MSITKENFREILSKEKAKCWLTYEEIAKKTGVGAMTVHHILNGRTKNPKPVMIKAIYDVLVNNQEI